MNCRANGIERLNKYNDYASLFIFFPMSFFISYKAFENLIEFESSPNYMLLLVLVPVALGLYFRYLFLRKKTCDYIGNISNKELKEEMLKLNGNQYDIAYEYLMLYKEKHKTVYIKRKDFDELIEKVLSS
jgi:hypothetical protein